MSTGTPCIGTLEWGQATRDESMTRSADGAATVVDLDTCDDRALVAAFLGGRRDAFDRIVVRHQRAVYGVCVRFVRNHEDAADLAQDVFVRAFKGLPKFKGDASLATWLYRIAVNVCLNRASARTLPVAPLDGAAEVDGGSPDALGRLLSHERSEAVRRAIDRLPPKQRAALTLRVYQECSHQEVADVLGTSVGAAKANFFHALGNLRRLLGS